MHGKCQGSAGRKTMVERTAKMPGRRKYPVRARGYATEARSGSASAKGGLPLGQEGAHALAEILAQIGLDDEVVALGRAAGELEAADGVLCDPEGDRSVAGDLAGHLAHALLQPVGRYDLIDESGLLRLLGGDEAGPEDQLLRPGGADEVDEAGVVGHREAVAYCAGDRDADRALWCAVAQIAGKRDRGPAARGHPRDGGNGRLRHRLQPRDDTIHPTLIVDRVLGRPEALELPDIGPRHERLAARSPEDQDAQLVVRVDRVARGG